MPFHEDELDAAEELHLQRIVTAEAEGDERAVEAALRPRSLDEVVGQVRVREQLGWCSRLRANGGGPPTTCCSPARRGWARPLSP